MQRSYLLLIFLVLPLFTKGQLHETFSDSNFTSNPTWIGETNFFSVSSGLMLQSNGPSATSQLHLSTPNNRCRNTEWSFYTKLDLDITTSNWARIYLTSDRADLENSPKGYYVKFDGTNNSIDLYRQDSSSHLKIVAGKSGRAGKSRNNIFLIKVICDLYGNWHLYSDTTASGDHYKKEGSALDTSFSTSSYCGVYFAHSATRRKLFFLDDFSIQQAPLSLLTVETISNTSIALSFNRPLDPVSASVLGNYSFLPAGNTIHSATIENENKNQAILQFSFPLNTYTLYTISVQGILDEQLQPVGFLNTFSFYYRPKTYYGDLLITEIMADPSPPVELPEYEYVEILNTTNDTLNLQGFVFSDGSTSNTFSAVKIPSNKYALLCHSDHVAAFSSYHHVIGCPNFPSLNNGGDLLTFRNHLGTSLHEVNYSDFWYQDNHKKEGGWALEMIDVHNPCGEASNWTASMNSSGGTPSQKNSVSANKPDLTPPQLISAYIVDSLHVQLTFDEKPLIAALTNSLFTIDKNYSVLKVTPSASLPEQLILEVSTPFALGELYTLIFANIKDCNGNGINDPLFVSLAMPQPATIGDILINEILFNPKSGGYDFVELYNKSEKYIDLKKWQLANLEDGSISNQQNIALEPFVLKPKEYIAFTENKSVLLNHYPLGHENRIFQLSNLPSYNDDKGTVILLDKNHQEFDRFNYSEENHFALLDDKEGISLERISWNESTDNSNNWHSAAASSGYATPGYLNSQNAANSNGNQMWVEPKIFTPDENGNKDFALIHYKFDTPGNTVNITIFDTYGRSMIQLAKNELLASEGFYRWDGNNTQNEKVRSGAYIVYFEMFTLKGEIRKYKEVVVVGWN